jgi:molybdenum cofactor cytidylyltransferase
MGQTKQLLLLGDKPVIRHCVDAFLAAGVPDIVIVAGKEKDGITEALRGLPVTLAVNAVQESDMAESARIGLKSCDPCSSGVLICPADHPLVMPKTVAALILEHSQSPERIIIPCCSGRRGHPSLFPLPVARELFLGGTLRDIVRRDGERVMLMDTEDDGILLDMDTPEDYERLKGKIRCP